MNDIAVTVSNGLLGQWRPVFRCMSANAAHPSHRGTVIGICTELASLCMLLTVVWLSRLYAVQRDKNSKSIAGYAQI